MPQPTFITVKTDFGPRQREALVYGKFAVHAPIFEPTWRKKTHAYSVSHLATGRLMTDIWGKARAVELARKLNAAVADDVTIEDQTDSPRYKAFLAAIKPVLQEFIAYRVAENE